MHYYTVQSMHNVKYDKDNKELVDLNGDCVTINSSVVVVIFDEVATEKAEVGILADASENILTLKRLNLNT